MMAAVIFIQNPNLKIAPVAAKLGANYHNTWTRYTASKERGEYTGPGRQPCFSKNDQYKFEQKIVMEYKNSQSMSYSRLQQFCEDMYEKKYNKLTPEQQENRPFQIPCKYCYPLTKRFDLKFIKPTSTEKDRNQCSTLQTSLIFSIIHSL